MKRIIFPTLLMATTLAVSCSNQGPSKYGFYKVKSGVDVSSLEGSPWLNTSIVDMAKKIYKPEAQDDYFTFANYETLIKNKIPKGSSKGGGTLYGVIDMMNERIDNVKNNSETYQAIKELAKTGAKDLLKSDAEQYFNITLEGLQEYASSVEFIRGSSSLLSLSNERGTPTFDFVVGAVSGLPTIIMGSVMFGLEDTIVSMLSDIAESQGFDRSTIEAKVSAAKETIEGYAIGLIATEKKPKKVKVSELSDVFNKTLNLEKIAKDLGFQDDDEIAYTASAEFVSSSIEDFIKDEEQFELFRTLLGITKVFENRYLIGAENVKNLYVNKLVDTGAEDKNITADLSTDKVADYITDILFNLVLDKEYSSTYITANARNRVKELIDGVVDGFTTVLENNDWLSADTKTKALEKMAAMHFEAFYSDEYETKENFTYTSSDVLNCYDEYYDYYISGIKDGAFYTDALHAQPVTTVNAAYSPTNNSFRIYHGIVAGFIDKEELSTEELYGRIATIIGHEITHGFDSTGAYYDKEGEYADWWTQEDKTVFEEKIQKMVNYYNSEISVLKKVPLNGESLTGEAIADMGGLKAVLEMAKDIENFDYDAFFKYNAAFYDFSYTKKGIETAIATDPHPIGYLRINLTYAQFDKFLEVYGIEHTDGMYIAPEDRIAIW